MPSNRMQKISTALVLITCATMVSVVAQQSFSGRLSDTSCGASHHITAAGLTDRQCVLACVKALAKYALVDPHNQLIPIANQHAIGLPFYAGRLVTLTGASEGAAVVVSKVEAIAAHLHLGHVTTNWRDTPGSRGFLPVAVDEARVAVLHAKLAAKSESRDDLTLHASHVLHALDPAVEPTGPGAGYGVKKAVTGAQQHLDLAARSEGASAALTADAAQVSASLANVLLMVDQAIAAAQKARATGEAAEAAGAAVDLAALVQRISDEGLEQVGARLSLVLKREGLLGAPR